MLANSSYIYTRNSLLRGNCFKIVASSHSSCWACLCSAVGGSSSFSTACFTTRLPYSALLLSSIERMSSPPGGTL